MDYSYLYKTMETTPIAPWLDTLPVKIDEIFQGSRWGDLPKWQKTIQDLPHLTPSHVDLRSNCVTIGDQADCGEKTQKMMEKLLRQLHPWRKGPFNIFGIHIDTEWRSDFKWDRFKDDIDSLDGRLVLDVGCGNGYHCWRMLGEGAKLVIGIDPTMLYVMQFHGFHKYVQDKHISILPLGIDDMPQGFNMFDTVFSLGLLYHRRSPLDHLLQLKSFLREGGQLVLETLVIEGGKGEVLNPEGRYAQMPNVWFIPTVPTLESWLKRMGFVNIRCVNLTQTTPEEQRVTDWMGFQSLSDFLDPNNPGLTVEGYPAPRRAVLLAHHP